MRRPGFALLASGLAALTVAGAVTTTTGHPRQHPRPPAVAYAAAGDDRPVLVAFRARATRAAVVRSTRPTRRAGRRRSPTVGHPRAPGSAPRTRRPVGLAAWLARPETRKIRRCESDDDYGLVDVNQTPTGPRAFYGAWQMDEDFLATYAHVRAADYVSHGRFTLSRSAQDAAAYAGWLARGDEPWACR